MLAPPNVCSQKNRGRNHGNRECQTVGRRDAFGILEDEQHGQCSHHKHPVNHWDIELTARAAWVAHLQVRHPVKTRSLRHHRVSAGNKRLRGDNAGHNGEHNRTITHGFWHHLEERVEVLNFLYFHVELVLNNPLTLAEVVKH